MRTWLVLLCWMAPLTAAAQGDPGDDITSAETRARAAFNSATVFFDAGDYEHALADFTRAYEESGRPELLYNIALCHERLERYEDAITALQRFGAAGAPGHDVESVQERVDELHRRIEERGPLPEPDGEDDADVAAAPASDPPPVVAIAGFSVAALGVVGFAIFGPLLLVEDQALWNECGASCASRRVSMLETWGILTDVSLGVALAGAVVGVIGLVVAPHAASTDSARLELRPWASTDAGGLVVGGTL